MTERVYCTYFDHNYLSRGVALYHSMQRHAPGSRLWVLCLSDEACKILAALNLPGIVAVSLGDFEAADQELAATRSSRSIVEYYFTCTAAWMLYVLKKEPHAEWITYLDGDLYFYQSPEVVFDELKDASIAIIAHRFAPNLEQRRSFGTYNVGWVGMRNDADGKAVVQWWRAKCIEWCYDHVDGSRYADQGYLDSFSALSPRVKSIENIGANLAPWNIANYRIDFRGGRVMVDQTPLVFFHFQGLRAAGRWFIFNSHRVFGAPLSRLTRNYIYRPYVTDLIAVEQTVRPILKLMK
ncbi:hypothetical protein ACTGJ9_018725 [Bradyrhizobium sp. RDM12]